MKCSHRTTFRTFHLCDGNRCHLVLCHPNHPRKCAPGRFLLLRWCFSHGIARRRSLSDTSFSGLHGCICERSILGSRSRACIWGGPHFTQGDAAHAEQAPQVFATTFGVVELLFRRMRIRSHTLALRIREGMLFQACQREGTCAGAQGTGNGPYQPILEDTHAANASLVEIVPVIHEVLDIHIERNLLEQRMKRALESLAIRLVLELIARKVEIMPPARGLAVQVAKV